MPHLLLDECLPKRLKWAFVEQAAVKTVPEMGWAGIKNGALLTLMRDHFDVFMTMDGNLQYQQPLHTLPIGFIVFSAVNNRYETLLPMADQARDALTRVQPGEVIVVSA